MEILKASRQFYGCVVHSWGQKRCNCCKRSSLSSISWRGLRALKVPSNPLDKWVFVLEIMQMQRRTWWKRRLWAPLFQVGKLLRPLPSASRKRRAVPMMCVRHSRRREPLDFVLICIAWPKRGQNISCLPMCFVYGGLVGRLWMWTFCKIVTCRRFTGGSGRSLLAAFWRGSQRVRRQFCQVMQCLQGKLCRYHPCRFHWLYQLSFKHQPVLPVKRIWILLWWKKSYARCWESILASGEILQTLQSSLSSIAKSQEVGTNWSSWSHRCSTWMTSFSIGRWPFWALLASLVKGRARCWDSWRDCLKAAMGCPSSNAQTPQKRLAQQDFGFRRSLCQPNLGRIVMSPFC